jgi:hypothetical protein
MISKYEIAKMVKKYLGNKQEKLAKTNHFLEFFYLYFLMHFLLKVKISESLRKIIENLRVSCQILLS